MGLFDFVGDALGSVTKAIGAPLQAITKPIQSIVAPVVSQGRDLLKTGMNKGAQLTVGQAIQEQQQMIGSVS